ncbi:MAG: ABC transporter ATP-binding protein [Hungatella sp.]|jgi:branched-chain amino acid transport system ATP-binding protein|nr:ABC transporter ATP-binding protein [Hungatella sp.]
MFFEINNITKYYRGLSACFDVSLHVNEHEIVGLIGPNGAGKSTLFQIIGGFVKPDAGSVFFQGEDMVKLTTSQINRAGIACTFQHAQLFPQLDVLESVMIGAYCHTKSKKAARQQAEELIAFTGLEGKESRRIDKLTMFDRKRVGVTVALATKPQLLLLDELYAGLNSTEISEMVTITKAIHQKMKITFLIVEHVIKVIMSICDRVYVLDYGKIIAECKPVELSKNPLVVNAYLGEDYDATQY